MCIPNTFYIDAKGNLIVGLKKKKLVNRIKQDTFVEADYGHRKNWRLFVNDGREMIWLHN